MGSRRMGRDRAIVDDAASLRLLGFHQFEGRLCTQKRTRQVDVDDVLPLLKPDVLKVGSNAADPRVVEQHIEPAKHGLDLRKQRRHRRGLAHVGGHRHSPERARQVTGFAHHLLQRLKAPARQHHAVTRRHQRQRHGLANARARARDQRHLVV